MPDATIGLLSKMFLRFFAYKYIGHEDSIMAVFIYGGRTNEFCIREQSANEHAMHVFTLSSTVCTCTLVIELSKK